MIFEQIPIGGKGNVAYLVGDETTRELVIIDAGLNARKILRRVQDIEARVKYKL